MLHTRTFYALFAAALTLLTAVPLVAQRPYAAAPNSALDDASANGLDRHVRARIHGLTGLELRLRGIDVDHGWHGNAEDPWVENVFPAGVIEALEREGFLIDILVDDVQRFSAARAAEYAPILAAGVWPSAEGQEYISQRRSPSDYISPADFTPGSMGGFYTLDEVYEKLDSLHARHPNLVSARTPVGALPTQEGRTQYMVKISDNVNLDETAEPNVLYTSLMHAREPAGMMSVVFFMQWLMENYGTDVRATFVVDRCQLYFVPVINPDGYVYNETIAPGGGGMWRKNRRLNPPGTVGVDLNRNWPYEWGYDDLGSSGSSSSDVFRGPGPASEPEIANLIALSTDRNFRTVLNYHSFGELLVYPWGYDTLLTPDHGLFRAASRKLTAENGYLKGTPVQTVGYAVNGGSDDWFYGEQSTKDKAFSWTPEVGTWFWPSPASILPIAQENALANLYLAFLATKYASVVGPFVSAYDHAHAAMERQAAATTAIIAPNPVQDVALCRGVLPAGTQEATFIVVDASGRIRQQSNVFTRDENGAFTINLTTASWSAGLYGYRILAADGSRQLAGGTFLVAE